MKKSFINHSLSIITRNNPNIDRVKLEEIEYGLTSIYLTYTKMIIISVIAIMLGIFKQYLLLLISYNIIRTNSFGLHASKSIYCLITSLVCFIGGVYLCEYISAPLVIKLLLTIICIICLIKYAPADTEKRPLINARKRKKYKALSVMFGSIYLVLILIFRNNIISNYLLLGLIEAVIMIHPLIYKLFRFPFDNYKRYAL